MASRRIRGLAATLLGRIGRRRAPPPNRARPLSAAEPLIINAETPSPQPDGSRLLRTYDLPQGRVFFEDDVLRASPHRFNPNIAPQQGVGRGVRSVGLADVVYLGVQPLNRAASSFRQGETLPGLQDAVSGQVPLLLLRSRVQAPQADDQAAGDTPERSVRRLVRILVVTSLTAGAMIVAQTTVKDILVGTYGCSPERVDTIFGIIGFAGSIILSYQRSL